MWNAAERSFFDKENLHIDPAGTLYEAPELPGEKTLIRVRVFVRSYVRTDLFAAEFATDSQSRGLFTIPCPGLAPSALPKSKLRYSLQQSLSRSMPTAPT